MTNDPDADIHAYLRLLDRVPETFRRSWDAIAIYDLEGRVMLGNAVARAMIGSERAATLQGRHFTTNMTLEAATKAARDFAHCVTLGRPVDSDSVFVDRDGQLLPVRTRLVPARLNGKLVGVIGFARDSRAQLDVQAQFMRSEQQFRSLFENHPDALALHDLEGRFLRVNAACVKLTGYSVEELVGQTPALVNQSGNFDAQSVRASMLRGETVAFDVPIRTKSGAIREVDGWRVPLHVDGKVRGWCSISRDVTEERKAARSSARQATRIAELYRIAASAAVHDDEKVTTALEAGLMELDAEWAYVARIRAGAIEIVQTAGEKPESGTLETTVREDGPRLRDGLAADDVFVVDDPIHPRSFAAAAFSVEGERYGAVVFGRRSGQVQVAATDRDYMRALAGLIGSAIQQGERTKHLDSLAFGDVLTGLPNRALLQDRLEQALLSARRHRRAFAAHYIDIDHFKTINDNYGHHVGDAVLVAVSGWLRSMLRDSDTIARFGGDEFVVLQPEIDSQRQAEDLAAKLCSIRDQVFRIGDLDISVTISVGCAVFPVDAESPIDMLTAADTALYEAKHRGRDGYTVGAVG